MTCSAVQNGVVWLPTWQRDCGPVRRLRLPTLKAKRSAGVADFNDLIAWTRRLLDTPGMGDWVRYKLDRRTDHILVDESQDTNARAMGDRSGPRSPSSSPEWVRSRGTAVGPSSWSVTSSRRFSASRAPIRRNSSALAIGFGSSRAALLEADEDARAGAALEFRDLSIEASYRSAPAVLDVVDAVIGDVGYRNMGLPDQPNRHRAHFHARPGRRRTLEAIRRRRRREWRRRGGGLARRRCATLCQCAWPGRFASWIDEAPILASTKRPLSAGDVLILVRSRGELASLIVARLFEEGVPVAGIDRLHLQEPLAVKDLLAAIAFAAQPLDDLNLANLLVSPLIGWSQERLARARLRTGRHVALAEARRARRH